MPVGIVINPIAGRGGSRPGEVDRRVAFARSCASINGVEPTVLVTERRGHARDLAQHLVDTGCDTVIAMGGDGTVNEVAQALVGRPVALGILPCGSGDGLARGLKLPIDAESALHVALGPATTAIDVGYAGDRIFLNIAGIGFDAEVGKLFATRSKRGGLGYVTKGLQLVWTYRAPAYVVSWSGPAPALEVAQVRRGRRFLIAFANAPEYGNGAVLAPDADPYDGLLDLLLAEGGHPFQQIWRARRLFVRHRQPAHGLERAQIRRATITGDVMVCHLDGEVFETSGTLEISVRPKALLVRTPFRRGV
ncbi:MAG: diacylglycerol kinase family lipid kinase [Acidobacteria bacterium]|jgi:diacylglycerol kinase (ATP)|nr:diacylglycerol kinase family lipid kinase [Acidobacteriota bacterium]